MRPAAIPQYVRSQGEIDRKRLAFQPVSSDSTASYENKIAESPRNWGLLLVIGAILLLLGVAAVAFPLLSTIATKIVLGWIFLVGGLVLVLHVFVAEPENGFSPSPLVGALYVVAGGWLAFLPFTGIVTLTILLAALFMAEGVLEVIMAVRVRPHEGWVWLLLSGLIAIAVGAMIAAQLPTSAEWAIGLLTGINLLSTGVSFVVLALAGRRAGRGAAVNA